MQSPKIEANLPINFQCLHWSQHVAYWIGRLWTFCTLSLCNLIAQVTTASFDHFASSSNLSQTPPSNDSVSLGKRKFKKEALEAEASEEDLNLFLLFGVDVPSDPSPSIVSSPPSPSVCPKAPKKTEGEPQQPEGTENNSTKKEEAKPKPQENIEEEILSSPAPMAPPKKFTRFKRIRKKSSAIKPGEGSKPTTLATETHPKPVTQQIDETASRPEAFPANTRETKPAQKPKPTPTTKPIYYDNPGKGDCQLYAILKGLEMQYPSLLKDQRKGQTGDLTVQKLRQMGVDFIRNQIDTCGEYAEDILGYLDSDRKEFNRAHIEPVKQKKDRERARIERTYKTQKNIKLYEKQKKAHEEKYQKIFKNLRENVQINTDEEFINRLEKNGFQCSTIHVFALSVLFKLPIYVKEQKGVKGFDLQMFDPTESPQEPIYLYRVADRHYQYIYYPKSSSAAK